MLIAAMVEKLFLFTTKSKEQKLTASGGPESAQSHIMKAIKSVHRITFSNFFLIVSALTLGKCPADKKKRSQALKVGSDRLDRHLDVVQLIRQSMAFASFQKLMLTHEERKLLKF